MLAQRNPTKNAIPDLADLLPAPTANGPNGADSGADTAAGTASLLHSSKLASPPSSQSQSTLASEEEKAPVQEQQAIKADAPQEPPVEAVRWWKTAVAAVRSTVTAYVVSAKAAASSTSERAVEAVKGLKAQGLEKAEQARWATSHPREAIQSAKAFGLTYVWFAEDQAVKCVHTIEAAFSAITGKAVGKTADIANNTRAAAKGLLGQVSTTGRQVSDNARWACQNPRTAATSAGAIAAEKGAYVRSVASDRKVQATAASAAGGAVALGSTGAATGMLGGAAVGAAAGLPAALFTFGLSIPVGAAIGGGAGFCTGAAVGGGVGLFGGGAAGYGAYTKQDAIKSSTGGAWANLKQGADDAKAKARESATSIRQRLVGRSNGSPAQ